MSTDIPADLHLKLRNLENEDYPQIASLMEEVYPDIGGAWSEESLLALIQDFAEGQIAIEDQRRENKEIFGPLLGAHGFEQGRQHSGMIAREHDRGQG